jgi:hypothetical protein
VLLFTVVFAAYAVLACRKASDRGAVRVNGRGPSDGVLFIVTWALWGLILGMWVFDTPGLLRRGRRERAILNDELVRHHRSIAVAVGFSVLVLAVAVQVLGLWLWPLPLWWPIASLSLALVAGATTFGVLDMRADG